MSTDTALLVIDAQVGLLEPAYRGSDVVARIKDLISRARTSGAPVVYLQHDGDAGGRLEPGTPGWRIHPEISPGEGDPVVRKRSSDSFYNIELVEVLEARGIRRVVVTGMKTEYCVDTTSRRAVSMGYDVTLATDAHTTTDTESLTAEQVVAHHNETLDDFGNDEHVVTIQPSGEITFEGGKG